MAGDYGVCLKSNCKLADSAKAVVVYADECNPAGKNTGSRSSAGQLEAMMAANPGATHLRIVFTSDAMQLFLVERD
ncbi:DUF3085 domain-containing protein [Sinorhizobium fredii]|uniref:DUF3085 domain-containing protein n=1 Tax=Rhizobium fredii TaxID=380 RepID=UPI00307746A3